MADGRGPKRLRGFERYLSVWVALCIAGGVLLGSVVPGAIAALVNLPVAVLIWLMIYPMMLRIDFAALRDVRRRRAPRWCSCGATCAAASRTSR